MEKEEKIQVVKDYIQNCNGTDKYHLHNAVLASANLTDGVKLVADTFGAYWMIDLILSYQSPEFKKKNHQEGNFIQYWSLKVNDDDSAVASMEFFDNCPVITQKIEYTDFPMKEFHFIYNTYDSVICLIAEN